MKQKHFYTHLIETSSISLELAEMDLDKDERLHLISITEANIHSVVLQTVLSELSDEDKKIFLTHLNANDHEKIWFHLKEKIENIEEKIKKAVDDLSKELYKDIQEAKKLNINKLK